MGLGVDEAFEGAGATPGMEVWRIKKLKVVKQEEESFGSFYSGDSYIVLVTKQLPNSPRLEWDIHFWLGKDTTQDEKGVAAYKTVELDEGLGGGPVQHREVHDHESKKFLSYFKAGIRYMDGGMDSGFKKVERDKYETRLMHIKGKRNVRVRQVKCHCSSLNQGDVFLLDCGLAIHVWCGPQSSKLERIKGAEVAKRISDEERGARAEIKIVDDRWDTTEQGWNTDPAFFEALGSQEDIRAADDGGDDTEFERTAAEEIKLFRVSDASGSVEVTEVGEKPLKREHLDSNDCFILDSGPSGIYAWIGRKCTKNEKKSAWNNATEFLTIRGYADWTPVTQVVEEGETPLFKQYFGHWTDPNDQTGLGKVHTSQKVAKQSNEKFETTTLHSNKAACKKESNMVDDGSGKTQVRVVQGGEPEHFLTIFKGKMVIFLGGINNKEPDSSTRLFQIRGTNNVNTKAIQVQPRAASLNSNDVFIVDTEKDIYLWVGKGASEEEKKVASEVVKHICPDRNVSDLKLVEEGQESPDFWDILGGQKPYATGSRQDEQGTEMPARLFQCSNASGRFKVEEVVDFSQEDLCEDDVMLLDTFTEVIVWVGSGANETEKKEALTTALEYIRTDPAGRNEDNTLILHIKQGFEPPSFTGHFHGWDPEKWSQGKTYEDLKREMGEDDGVTSVKEELANYFKTHPVEELRKTSVPKGVDPSCKEKHLTDADFEEVFGMSRTDYLNLRPWRQIDLKKKMGLF
ncbi:hypothetical protein ACOMHN_049695 [Nucella lapillus]